MTTKTTKVSKPTKKAASPRSLTEMPIAFYEINDRFKLVRMEEDLSQAAFADMLGLGVSYIKQIEFKSFTPGIHAIKQLHKVFGKSYDWIIDGRRQA